MTSVGGLQVSAPKHKLTGVLARRECFCNYQFNVKACSVQGIFKTSDVVQNDPESLACPADTINLMSMSACSLI